MPGAPESARRKADERPTQGLCVAAQHRCQRIAGEPDELRCNDEIEDVGDEHEDRDGLGAYAHRDDVLQQAHGRTDEEIDGRDQEPQQPARSGKVGRRKEEDGGDGRQGHDGRHEPADPPRVLTREWRDRKVGREGRGHAAEKVHGSEQVAGLRHA